jgi:energy-converting hydrogenase A subunit M
MEFRNIYELTSKEEAKQKILNWISKTKLLQVTIFNTVANSLNYHLETIINLFIKRNTNAESFNSKIKLFRAN